MGIPSPVPPSPRPTDCCSPCHDMPPLGEPQRSRDAIHHPRHATPSHRRFRIISRGHRSATTSNDASVSPRKPVKSIVLRPGQFAAAPATKAFTAFEFQRAERWASMRLRGGATACRRRRPRQRRESPANSDGLGPTKSTIARPERAVSRARSSAVVSWTESLMDFFDKPLSEEEQHVSAERRPATAHISPHNSTRSLKKCTIPRGAPQVSVAPALCTPRYPCNHTRARFSCRRKAGLRSRMRCERKEAPILK